MRPVTTIRALAFALATLPLSAAFSGAIARPTVEVAFVLDTTGSMGGLIEGAKRKIWSIATAIVDSNPDADIRMGLVAYRDIGDDYVTRTFDLTADIQDLYANLLELKARGGGDWPESVNEALDVAVNKLRWTQASDVRRIVFLVGDAPPHMDYAQDTKYPTTLAVAKQKDIIALNQKLSALVAKRDKFVAEQRDKAPPKASSFDRVVEDTLKAQIKR